MLTRPLALCLTLCAALAPGCAACDGPTLSEQLATGVARLTVLDAAALLVIADDHAPCAFADATVQAAATHSADIGRQGTRRVAFEDCTVTFDAPTVIQEDCDGVQWTATGTVTLGGALEMTGLLTGNDDAPVAPHTPDAARLELSARFDEFDLVTSADDENHLTHHAGALSFGAVPRLAALDRYPGICGAVTPHVAFSDIVWDDARLTLHTDRSALPLALTVPSSSLDAQTGQGPDTENHLAGTIDIDGTVTPLPVAGDEGLDPAYDRASFVESYQSCVDETADDAPLRPETDVCPGLDRLFAVRTGQAAVRTLAAVVDLLEQDDACGFDAPGRAPVIDGAPGQSGTATTTIAGCTVALLSPRAVHTDCTGETLTAQGAFTVSGARTVSGVVDETGTFVIPAGDRPLVYDLDVFELDDLRLSADATGQTVAFSGGGLAATVERRWAAGPDGGCAVKSPVLRVDPLTMSGVEATLVSDELTAVLDVSAPALFAVRGRWGDDVNALRGDVTVDGVSYSLFRTGVTLEPYYTQADFDAAWTCDEALAAPVSFDCGP